METICQAPQAGKGAVVLTSISAPNAVMQKIASDCASLGMPFFVIGDTKSPDNFNLNGCQFFSYKEQCDLELKFSRLCPPGHYARKNIGYLLAVKGGAEFIVETDDDNMPSAEFYQPLPASIRVPVLEGGGWINVYGYYTDHLIWPRGLPLDAIQRPLPPLGQEREIAVPIQQGLANDNPDVDAIYRLTLPLPFTFERSPRVALGTGAWCPYNSQNTIHYRQAFPLLYLPAYCSFRMTDIWRSFVAQRIAWLNGWAILFREATVTQDRNDHNLMKDFEDEISGYLGNRRIGALLDSLDLPKGEQNIPAAMRMCYAAMAAERFVGHEELPLLEAWLNDISNCWQT